MTHTELAKEKLALKLKITNILLENFKEETSSLVVHDYKDILNTIVNDLENLGLD